MEKIIDTGSAITLHIVEVDSYFEFYFHSWAKGRGEFSYTRLQLDGGGVIVGNPVYFENIFVPEGDCLTRDVCLTRGPVRPLYNSIHNPNGYNGWMGYEDELADPNLSWTLGTIEDAQNGAKPGTFAEILDHGVGDRLWAIIENGSAMTLHYSLPEIALVSLTIYDIAGQVVRHLVYQKQVAGSHQVVWDGLDKSGAPTANGVYLYELRAGKFRALRKMLLLK